MSSAGPGGCFTNLHHDARRVASLASVSASNNETTHGPMSIVVRQRPASAGVRWRPPPAVGLGVSSMLPTLEVVTLTVNLPEDLAARLAAEATRRGITVDDVLAEMVADRLPARRRLSFIGIGHSGGGESVAENHKEIIRAHFADKTASDV